MSTPEEIVARLDDLRAYPQKHLTDPGVNKLRHAATAAVMSLPNNDAFLAQMLEKEYQALGVSGDLLVCVVLYGALAERKAQEALPIFHQMLSDTRTQAMHEDLAETLGQMGDASSVPSLIEALSSREAWVRAKAARSLGHLKDARAIATLTMLLKKDESDTVRENVIKAVVEADATEASAALLDLAACPDESSDLRTTAIKALVRMRALEAVPLLKNLHKQDADEDVREAANQALLVLDRPK
jgi:HEAT repeat protein